MVPDQSSCQGMRPLLGELVCGLLGKCQLWLEKIPSYAVLSVSLPFSYARSNTPAAHSRCATDKTARSFEEDRDWTDGHTGQPVPRPAELLRDSWKFLLTEQHLGCDFFF